MPVSAVQHRLSAGTYQNKLHANLRENATQAQGITPDNSVIPNEIRRFGRSINQAVNSHEELNRASLQNTAPLRSEATPLLMLMLLSQFRLADYPLSATSDNSVFVSDRALLPSFSGDPGHSASDNSGFSTMLSPVANALHGTGKFLSRYDPLKFPGAEAAPLLSAGTESEIATNITRDIKNGSYIITDEQKKITKSQSIPCQKKNYPDDFSLNKKNTNLIKRELPDKEESEDNIYLSSQKKHEKNINFLSDSLTSKIRKIIDATKNDEKKMAITKTINELNNVIFEAEKKFSSGPVSNKIIDYLIYIIDKSKSIIDGFEIKYSQKDFCKNLRLQQKNYILMAKKLSNAEGRLKFKKYIESIPSLTFTPDSRGEGYPSVESQIAGDLVRSVFWIENDQAHSATYGHRYNAYKALLTCLLAEKKITDLNQFPNGWYKGNKAIYLVNLLFRDSEHNLKNKGKGYFVKPAELFYLSLREEYRGYSTLDIDGLEKKTLMSYSDEDKLLALMYFLKQPIDMEYNQVTNSQKLLGMINFFITIQSITGAWNGIRHLSLSSAGKGNWYGHSRVKAGNLKLKYNKNTHELDIQATDIFIGSGKRVRNHIKRNNLRVKKFIDSHKEIGSIKFQIKPSLSHVSNELKRKIQPSMYAKNVNVRELSPPNSRGLMTDKNGNKYVKIDNSYLNVKQKDGNSFISKHNREAIHLEYRNGKFHLESRRKQISRIRNTDLSRKKLTPAKLIANTLGINKAKDEEILSKYEFPKGSKLYTKKTFALAVQKNGRTPDWAKSFKKLEFLNYTSPFKKNKLLDNQLRSFSDKKGYYYRVDSNPPHIVEKNGFDTTMDYTAIRKMLPRNVDGVTVAGSLKAAQRYRLRVNKNAFIYRIEARNIEGVSLKYNLMMNEEGLRKFLKNNSGKKYSTLNSLADDTNGAIYLDEIHLVKKDIKPGAIKKMKLKTGNENSLSEGPWQNYL